MSDSSQKKTLSLKKTSDKATEPSQRSQANSTHAKKPLRRGKAGARDRTKVPDQYRANADSAAIAPSQKPTPQAVSNDNNQQARKPANDTRDRIKQSSLRQAPTRGGKLRDGYDPERQHSKQPKPQAAQENGQPRLSKVMADRGLCSRREADAWIENGWVKVNGQTIDVLGTRVSRDAEITVHQEAINVQAESVTFLLHKPIGYVSGQPEDGYEPAVALLTAENEWTEPNLPENLKPIFRKHMLRGLAPAGRLDIDSTGLLVMTQDGRVARELIGEHSSVEKEYLVRVEGQIIPNGLQLLNVGLSLDDQPLKRAKVSWQNEDQLRFVLKEGKKRQIRRMCELVGLKVVGLKRIRIGQIPLSKLPVGQWRFLGPNERF